MTWLFVSTSPDEVRTIPVPAAAAPWKARFVSMTTTPLPIGVALDFAPPCARAITAATEDATTSPTKTRRATLRGTLRTIFTNRSAALARNLERELRRAAARVELGDLVPVDEVRECLGEDVAQAKTLQLLDAPGMDQQLLVDCVLDELGI